jgi:hypothetical protein
MSNSNVKPTRTDKYGTWEQQSELVWTLIPGTETQLWWDEHPAPEPTPDEPDEPAPAPTVWDELAAAYQEGVNSIDE